jgi:hypothetical protein
MEIGRCDPLCDVLVVCHCGFWLETPFSRGYPRWETSTMPNSFAGYPQVVAMLYDVEIMKNHLIWLYDCPTLPYFQRKPDEYGWFKPKTHFSPGLVSKCFTNKRYFLHRRCVMVAHVSQATSCRHGPRSRFWGCCVHQRRPCVGHGWKGTVTTGGKVLWWTGIPYSTWDPYKVVPRATISWFVNPCNITQLWHTVVESTIHQN